MATLRDKVEEKIRECNRVGKYGTQDFNATEALDKIMEEIDKENKILRPALRWFAEEMETDLIKNDFKGGWLDGRLEYYRGKAIDHTLKITPFEARKVVGKEYIIKRCIKAANYLMMIAHNLIEELRKAEKD